MTKTPRILIACEYSGIVRTEFSKLGWDAWSCDLLDTEIPGNHYKGNVLDIIDGKWDLLIAPKAAEFFMQLYQAPVNHICVENPQGIISKIFRETGYENSSLLFWRKRNEAHFSSIAQAMAIQWTEYLTLTYEITRRRTIFKKEV